MKSKSWAILGTILFLVQGACLQLASATTGKTKQMEAQLLQASPLALEDVRLLGGPLKHAQDRDCQILLGLVPDRMLAPYRQAAGLEPKAKGYGGWDGGGRNLTEITGSPI